MTSFLTAWGDAALTTLGYFWIAFWAFGFGYLVSSGIQVFVTEKRMRHAMGGSGPKAVALGTFFGFISSSCSFAALASARSLYAKGAGFVPAMAFLLASTNLVIELGIVIAVFLSWHFVVGEYLGGILLILIMWLLVRLTRPTDLLRRTRERLESAEDRAPMPVGALAHRRKAWQRLAETYLGEWRMVWKDVTVGFTVAGIIATFVPAAFFTVLFPGSGPEAEPGFGHVLMQALVGPVAAFFTFIGSMGNIPLAGILYGHGVSMAGVMAFIFSDLVVLPVLRVNAQFYGWKLALYIAGVFLVALVAAALLIHYGFAALGLLPHDTGDASRLEPEARFAIDYTFYLNMAFLALSALFGWLALTGGGDEGGHGGDGDWVETTLRGLAVVAIVWLAAGVTLHFAL